MGSFELATDLQLDSFKACHNVASKLTSNRPFIQLFGQNTEPNHR